VTHDSTERRILLHRIQSVLVVISATLIITVILLDMFSSHTSILCFFAYLFGAISYGAEIVIILYRAKEHQVHKTEWLMPVLFGFVYILLAVKYLYQK